MASAPTETPNSHSRSRSRSPSSASEHSHLNPEPSNGNSNGHAPSNGTHPSPSPATKLSASPLIGPTGIYALSSISLQSYTLGLLLGLSTLSLSTTLFLTWLLHTTPSSFTDPVAFLIKHLLPILDRVLSLWRIPFFVSALSIFHFLEFYTTSLANPTLAKPSAFLLSSNGLAYNAAHTLAIIECFVNRMFLPSLTLPNFLIPLGTLFVIAGQTIRSKAMLTAGTSFNHIVQTTRREEHVLVRHGVYKYLRHPSYMGYWYFAVGTQLVLGNIICSVVYAVVLWVFFKRRIDKEEGYLEGFFGKEYDEYRSRTVVGIPFLFTKNVKRSFEIKRRAEHSTEASTSTDTSSTT